MITAIPNPIGRPDYSNDSRSHGFLKRFFDRLTIAQAERANRVVNQHLATFSDQELRELGRTAVEIAAIRKYPAIRVTV